MALLTRKRIVLAKIESSYGVDAAPTGSANAMLVKNLTLTPISAETVSRDLIRPYLGNSETLLATVFTQIQFEVELAGAGASGKVPAYDPLLRACGFERRPAVTVSAAITRTGTTATAVATAHGFQTGDRVLMSGAVEGAYNGEFVVTRVDADTFTYQVVGSPSTPATGSPVAGRAIEYAPISGPFESATLLFNVDGVEHLLRGCRGSVQFQIGAREIPVMQFTLTGLFSSPEDQAAPTPDFSGFQIPRVANTQNTAAFSLHGYSGVLESMSLDVANDVQYLSRIGQEKVEILNRAPAGTFVIEAPSIATKDFFTIARDSTLGAMQLIHGTVGGNKVQLFAPTVSLQNPNYQDVDGVHFLSIPYTAVPDSGDDELIITVY